MTSLQAKSLLKLVIGKVMVKSVIGMVICKRTVIYHNVVITKNSSRFWVRMLFSQLIYKLVWAMLVVWAFSSCDSREEGELFRSFQHFKIIR